MRYWEPCFIDAIKPYVPQSEYDKPARPNARIIKLRAARDIWASRNVEFSIRTGCRVLLERRETLYTQLDHVEGRIYRLPATSLEGLVVKAKVAKWKSTLWVALRNDLDRINISLVISSTTFSR